MKYIGIYLIIFNRYGNINSNIPVIALKIVPINTELDRKNHVSIFGSKGTNAAVIDKYSQIGIVSIYITPSVIDFITVSLYIYALYHEFFETSPRPKSRPQGWALATPTQNPSMSETA